MNGHGVSASFAIRTIWSFGSKHPSSALLVPPVDIVCEGVLLLKPLNTFTLLIPPPVVGVGPSPTQTSVVPVSCVVNTPLGPLQSLAPAAGTHGTLPANASVPVGLITKTMAS